MAEIKIEKKKAVWPWVILVIVLVVLAFLYFYGSASNDEIDDTEMEEIGFIQAPNQTSQNQLYEV